MNKQKYFSEFIGTGFLFAAVVGSGIMGQNLSPNNDGVILLVNTIATVFALYFLIVSFQKYSANFNPVVSMVMFLNGRLSFKDLIIYAFLQIIDKSLKETRYDDEAELAEEKKFLKNYTIPFVQLDPKKSILCFAHAYNTFDKRRLLENPNPNFVRETKMKLKNFIKDKKIAAFYHEQ